MIIRLLRWLARRARPRRKLRRGPELRMLMIESRTTRIARAADVEGIEPMELEDAIQHMALNYPVTEVEVLEVVETHGLEKAQAKIEALLRDDD